MKTIERMFERYMNASYEDVDEIEKAICFEIRKAFYAGFGAGGNVFMASLKTLPEEVHRQSLLDLRQEYLSFAEFVDMVHEKEDCDE